MAALHHRQALRDLKLNGARLLLLCLVCFALGALFLMATQRLQNRLRRVANAAESPPLDARLHARRQSQFASLNSSDRILMVGDSRIDEGEWDELLGRDDVANRGISGDTIAGLLARFDATFPRAVAACVLQVGINDLMQGAPVEQTERNYRKLLQQIQDQKLAGTIVLTSAVLTGAGSPELNERVTELNNRLKHLAEERGVKWLDLNAALAPRGHLDEKYTNDGTHLTAAGYQVFAAALKPLIHELPEDP